MLCFPFSEMTPSTGRIRPNSCKGRLAATGRSSAEADGQTARLKDAFEFPLDRHQRATPHDKKQPLRAARHVGSLCLEGARWLSSTAKTYCVYVRAWPRRRRLTSGLHRTKRMCLLVASLDVKNVITLSTRSAALRADRWQCKNGLACCAHVRRNRPSRLI